MTTSAALPALDAAEGASRVLVVHNPTAGRRRRRRLAATTAELERLGCRVELYATRAAGDATRYLRSERPDYDAVVAAGGDGTVNEVVNGLRPGEALGVLPLGTVNVLARELGLPMKPRAVAAAIERGAARPIYPGVVAGNGRRFLMMVGIGFDAWVVGGVDLALKRRIGRSAYGVALLRQLGRYGKASYTLTVNGTEHRCYAAIVTRIRLYGGSFVLSREASLERRELRVVLFTARGLFGLLRALAAFVAGRLELSSGVTAVTGTEVSVEGPAGETTQIDGDVGDPLPLSLVVEERSIRILGYGAARGEQST